MTLTGILKNILLVLISVLIWHTTVSWLQFLGYAVALAGLVYYSVGWEQIVGISQGVWLYAKGVAESARNGGSSATTSGAGEENAGRLPSAVRRALIMGLAALTVLVLVGGFFYGGGAAVVGGQFGTS